MSPAVVDGKRFLNEEVKGREHWRPYSASVLSEYYGEWFDIKESSPHMLRAVPTRKDKRHLIPAVVHVDGTCRIQTVSADQNPLFHRLIEEFNRLSGIPMLLNTSLNMAGEPIYSTRSQCKHMIQQSSLAAICIGDTLIGK
jgi:carbamoyltransferase